jgi:hypothetical protein
VEQIYEAACRIAVDLLGADRSTFVQFDESKRYGFVKAEWTHKDLPKNIAGFSAYDLRIPLDDPHEQNLLESKPIKYYDIEEEVEEGPFKDNLRKFAVKSVLIVPVVDVPSWDRSVSTRSAFTASSMPRPSNYANCSPRKSARLSIMHEPSRKNDGATNW